MTSYLQTSTSECGIACVGYIAAYYGYNLDMRELRALYPISTRGTTLNDLVILAQLVDLNTRPVKLGIKSLSKIGLPCILHWDFNHFVVLVKVTKKNIIIHDPAKGKKVIDIDEVGKHFTGIALEFSPSLKFKKQPAKPIIKWYELIGKIYGFKRSLFQLFILAAGIQITLLVTPLFMQWTLDTAIVSKDTDLLYVLILGLFLTVTIKSILEFTRGWFGIILSNYLGVQWGGKVMQHLLNLPTEWYELRHSGDIVSRFQSVQIIQQTLTGKLVEILLDGILVSITLIVMLLYSIKLTLIVVLAILIYSLIRILPHGYYHKVNEEAIVHEAKANSHFLESIRASQTIKLARLEAQRSIRWINIIVDAINKRVVSQKLGLSFSVGYSFVFGIESLAILGVGATMVINNSLTIGMLVAFIAYKDTFSTRAQSFIDNIMSTKLLNLHAERLADIVLSETESINYSNNLNFHLIEPPTIFFDNVTFRYAENGPIILKNLNLKINSGEHVAIVGQTGCGKTTFAKLLLGLIKPTSGCIYINDLPLEKIGLVNWREYVSAVMQDDQLFSGSIFDNISTFDENRNDEFVIHSAKLAAIHEDVMAMPMGYQTLNGDMGSSLSGGQKQRVLLARAIYKNPKLIVLDEATSHLDIVKEKEVNDSINQLRMTRVTIAHRPETIAMADRVIQLNDYQN
ncbi:peptidase domain-containing ABC transporter [Acinetobacter lactucae]|uniref:Peptidase domain-containing ABC transporter n=1 Tax=Acinetobacter lactucae TaxID=1785128 RepID=A0AB35K3S5_9GAMM|nr:peptidase domain-containing ABC transporter [Acinetobacter lactucae]MDD9320146.1 peptidase domain-containing ABC transporter [Acinetobacter lactucae]